MVIQRKDLENHHEEADVIIVNQAVHSARCGSSAIRVVSDDTDVFVLLCHFYLEEKLTCDLVMASTSTRRLIDVRETVQKHKDILPDLMAAHSLSGCDTVSGMYGIGKGKVIKVLRSGTNLRLLGKENVPVKDLLTEAYEFVAACYGYPKEDNVEELRFKVWSVKMANSRINSAPQLKILPPTQPVFEKHVLRAHLQAAIWRASLSSSPPEMDPLAYGWIKGRREGEITPIGIPSNIAAAPPNILKMIKCGCSSSAPCSSMRCSCSSAMLSCSVFCSCQADENCKNKQTIAAKIPTEDEDSSNVSLIEVRII